MHRATIEDAAEVARLAGEQGYPTDIGIEHQKTQHVYRKSLRRSDV